MMTRHIERLIRPVAAEQKTHQIEPKRDKTGKAEIKDQVTLSAEAQELLQLQRKIAAQGPEVRVERCRELHEAIAKGTYDIPADKIAAGMLRYWGLLSRR
ncbi:MAG TPA: flagellar biosynthesis anti-sigma factor FlgM [Firmicutes bacterium]|nr:flagellar biosynthesis anti-sigma factor FlgM [Bacillota bacterium]